VQDPGDIVSSIFICTYNNSFLRIYHRKYKSFPRALGGFFGTSKPSKEEKSWHSEVILERPHHLTLFTSSDAIVRHFYSFNKL
jgi:hypothetical protein